MRHWKSIFLVLSLLVFFTGCDNGDSSSPSRSSEDDSGEAPTPTKKVFAILNDLSGDLKTDGGGTNGPDGADNLCQADGQSAGGTYKAMVVDGVNRVACTTANCGGGASEHVDWVFSAHTKYVRADDATVIVGETNSKGLFDFPLQNDWIQQAYDIWTGLETDWTTSTNNCSGFTDSAQTSKIGYTNATTVNAISSNTYNCNYYGTTILCIEQ